MQGLDELMIVNPGPLGSGGYAFKLGDLVCEQCGSPLTSFSSLSGRLAVELGEEGDDQRGDLFLGEDGTVYELVRDAFPPASGPERSRRTTTNETIQPHRPHGRGG